MSTVFGGDIGFKQFKGSCKKHNLEFKFDNIIGFPSSLEIEQAAKKSDMLKDLSVVFEERMYYIGDKAVNQATNHRYTFLADKVSTVDETIKMLTALGILHQHGVEEIDTFVTGVPVEEYHMIKDKLEKEFKKSYSFKFRDKDAKSQIKEVMVVPQGAGDYYNYILDDEAKIIEERVKPKTLVVNIGYRTTELVTMNYGKFSRNESTTLYTATNSFHKELRRILVREYGIRKTLTQIDEIYRNGKVFIKGKEEDITPFKAEAVSHHIGSIIGEIPIWVNIDDIHEIILAGGGSSGLKETFEEEFGEIVTEVDDPEGSQAKGYDKFGRFSKHA